LALAPTIAIQGRAALIEMARVWTRLADEQGVALPPNVIDQSQPIIQQQQQQQVQPKKDGDTE
jgi:hypothetical protein